MHKCADQQLCGLDDPGPGRWELDQGGISGPTQSCQSPCGEQSSIAWVHMIRIFYYLICFCPRCMMKYPSGWTSNIYISVYAYKRHKTILIKEWGTLLGAMWAFWNVPQISKTKRDIQTLNSWTSLQPKQACDKPNFWFWLRNFFVKTPVFKLPSKCHEAFSRKKAYWIYQHHLSKTEKIRVFRLSVLPSNFQPARWTRWSVLTLTMVWPSDWPSPLQNTHPQSNS